MPLTFFALDVGVPRVPRLADAQGSMPGGAALGVVSAADGGGGRVAEVILFLWSPSEDLARVHAPLPDAGESVRAPGVADALHGFPYNFPNA